MMPEIPEAIKTLTKCVLQKWHIGAFRKETKGIVRCESAFKMGLAYRKLIGSL